MQSVAQNLPDPFSPLVSVLERYRYEVHAMEPPASDDAVARAIVALGQALPPALQQFVARWNGGVLFRGALSLRSVNELAPAAEDVPGVVVFADGPRPEDHWAFAWTERGDAVFGRWDGQRFELLHESFGRWLEAMVRILDENVREPQKQLELRAEVEPGCGALWLHLAEHELADGRPDEAMEKLRKATALDPELGRAWRRMGDAFLGVDKGQARWAYLKALRATRLPARFPTGDLLEPEVVRSLGRLFPHGDDGWERELDRFLVEAVRDAHTFAEVALVEAVSLELARLRLHRGDREGAHGVLSELLDRARGFRTRGTLTEAVLLLAEIDTDLGHHDDAEKLLRVLRQEPPAVRARADLALGRIACIRQEPWAEDILREALEDLVDPRDKSQAWLLLGERALLHEDHDRAQAAFNEATRLAAQAGDTSLSARAAMGQGDVMRVQGQGPMAEACYREAREQAGEDQELLLRILIRRGDMFRLVGNAERAAADYERACEGYKALGLPIREAWARLRLAQMQGPAAAVRALELFKQADLAAGVAAADSVQGDPSASLDWHLERATEHAKDRANAQRARPPLTRADADRPERRLGAHRMAIAACNKRIVATLARELDQATRHLDVAKPRRSDPNLARYVAAADLLAAHRSYEAAEELLRQLFETRPQGLAGRALVGAMARSPNAALVDGLLDALEGDRDPTAIAAATEVLGWRREAHSVAVLRRLCAPAANRTVRRAAVVALGRIGDREAVADILPAMETPELAADASVALLLLGEWEGVDYQAQLLAQQDPNLATYTGEIVGRFGGPQYLLLLMRTADLEGSAGVGALQGLGYLGDPRVVPILLDATGSRDQTRSQVASMALEILTGHHEDPEESLLRTRWAEWWDKNREGFQDGLRYRYGRLVDPGAMIERLAHDDPFVRRSSYDELVISVGERLPFDHEGPYRVQLIHQAQWRRWWRAHRETFATGRWWFQGEQIG